MKVNPHDPTPSRPVSGSPRSTRTEPTRRDGVTGSAAGAAPAPGLSDRARLAQAATAALTDLPAENQRQQRLADLQAAIDAGAYQVPVGDMARRLWQSGAIRW